MIKVSEKAVEELKKINLGERYLRLNVVAGGCAGMTYSAAIDEQKKVDDLELFSEQGITIISDQGNAMFLQDLEIDFSDDLIQAGFRFKNPHASGSCGCGASFAG